MQGCLIKTIPFLLPAQALVIISRRRDPSPSLADSSELAGIV